MATTNPTAPWLLPNNTTQNPTLYKGSLDGCAAVGQRVVSRYSVEAITPTPIMSVLVNPGNVLNGITLTEVGQQSVCTTVSGTNTITMTGPMEGISIGMSAYGFWYNGSFTQTQAFPANTFVTGISGLTVTLNNNALISDSGVVVTFYQRIGGVFTGNAHGTTIVDNLQSTTSIFVGMLISGTGVTGGTTVTSVDSASQIHTSATVTTGSAIAFTFAIPAPASNPRLDRVVADCTTGLASWILGTAASTPVPPAIPTNKMPLAQLLIQTSSTSITNAMIKDERVTNLGAPSSLLPLNNTWSGSNLFAGAASFSNSASFTGTLGCKQSYQAGGLIIADAVAHVVTLDLSQGNHFVSNVAFAPFSMNNPLSGQPSQSGAVLFQNTVAGGSIAFATTWHSANGARPTMSGGVDILFYWVYTPTFIVFSYASNVS